MKKSSPKPEFETELAKVCTNLNFHLKLYKEDIEVGKMIFYIENC